MWFDRSRVGIVIMRPGLAPEAENFSVLKGKIDINLRSISDSWQKSLGGNLKLFGGGNSPPPKDV